MAAKKKSKNFSKENQWVLAPSVLSADFSKLKSEVEGVELAARSGISTWLHVDVMDGSFVPNITFGPWLVQTLKKITSLELDCHLMVSQPELWVPLFAKAGASRITVHAESTKHLDRLIHQVKETGCKVGVSINPATPVSTIVPVLDLVDLVLVMSVNPGFGGQKFIPYTLDKIRELKAIKERSKNKSFLIQVDGGVSLENINVITKAGANVLVAGSAIFGELDRNKAMKSLLAAAHK